MADAFSMGLNLVDLKKFTSASQEKIKAAVRPAAQAGAQVLYNEVKANVSGLGRKTGRLAASIYQAYSESASGDLRASYNISWNKKKAPHGHLVEFGYVQRYRVYFGDDGRLHTAVRDGMKGKPKPRRNASQSEKDAYYLPLPIPRIVPAHSFLRAAIASKADAVRAAMQAEFQKRLA